MKNKITVDLAKFLSYVIIWKSQNNDIGAKLESNLIGASKNTSSGYFLNKEMTVFSFIW